MRKARCFSYVQKGNYMITVTIEKGRIKASGHAGTAPKGQDLVCAAFTMLCHSLIESFRKLTADSFIYKIDSGSFYFECALPSGQRNIQARKADLQVALFAHI